MVSYDGLHERKHSRQMAHTYHTCGPGEAYSWGGLLEHSSVNKTGLQSKTSMKSHLSVRIEKFHQGRLTLCQALAAVRCRPTMIKANGSRY